MSSKTTTRLFSNPPSAGPPCQSHVHVFDEVFITDIGCLIPADGEKARVIYSAIPGSSPTVCFYLFDVQNTKQLLSGTLPVFQFDTSSLPLLVFTLKGM